MNIIKNFVMNFNLGELAKKGQDRLEANNFPRVSEEFGRRINLYMNAIPINVNFELYITKGNKDYEYMLFFEILAGDEVVYEGDKSRYGFKIAEGGREFLSLTNEQLWNMIVEKL